MVLVIQVIHGLRYGNKSSEPVSDSDDLVLS